MPTYEYYCSSCDKDIEVFHSIKADPITVCPECDKKGKIKRKISSGAGIIFKGSGFYETDYKRNSKSSESDSTQSSTATASKEKSSSKKDSKPKKKE